MARRRHRYLGLLHGNRDFRRLWTAQLVSFTGDRSGAVALLGVVLGITDSGLLASAVLAANMASPLLVFPLVSRLVDRVDRRRLMVTVDLFSGAIALTMMLVTSPGTIWVGIAAVLAIGMLTAFGTPASQASVPNLVEPADLDAANALLGSCHGIALGIGPLLGGVVSATLGYDYAFGLNALSFVTSAYLVSGIRRPFRAANPPTLVAVAGPGGVRAGYRYARSSRPIMALLSIKALFAVAGGGAFVLLPIFAVKVFRSGDLGIGMLMCARGLGALSGPFVARALVGGRRERLFVVLGLSGALYGAAYTLFAVSPSLWIALPLVTLAHGGGFALWTMEGHGLQVFSVDDRRGRLFALDFTMGTSLLGLSMLVTGHLAGSVNVRVLAAAEAALLLVCSLAWIWATRPLWSQPATGGTGRGREPSTWSTS